MVVQVIVEQWKSFDLKQEKKINIVKNSVFKILFVDFLHDFVNINSDLVHYVDLCSP